MVISLSELSTKVIMQNGKEASPMHYNYDRSIDMDEWIYGVEHSKRHSTK